MSLAAQYVRMSTDMQKYSIDNQKAAIALYAAAHDFQIVRTYADEGRSGLDLKGRKGLRSLLDEVKARTHSFEAILVYDVSRWGRFQDVDESAYYEFLCREAGIMIHYCAEEFGNDGSMSAAVLKAIKRTMAAEYSRELSNRVFVAKCSMTLRGFRHGGRAGFGLRRMILDETGKQKGILENGQQKFVHSDRTVLVPGPAEEVRLVRWMYSEFVEQNRSLHSIVGELNARGVANSLGRPWSRGQVRNILSNEKYVGNNVFGRTSCRLKTKTVRVAPRNWIRAANVFEPIVERELFDHAQDKFIDFLPCPSRYQLLDHLCGVWCRYGGLSAVILRNAPVCPSASTYRKYFGSLLEAFSAIGYPGISRRPVYISLRKAVADQIIEQVRATGGSALRIGLRRQTRIRIDGELLVTISLAHWSYKTRDRKQRWVLKNSVKHRSDIVVLPRYDQKRSRLVDYYILPGVILRNPQQIIMDENGIEWDSFRAKNVSAIAKLIQCVELDAGSLHLERRAIQAPEKSVQLKPLTFTKRRNRPVKSRKLLNAFSSHSKRVIAFIAKAREIDERQSRLEEDLRHLFADRLFRECLLEHNLGRVPAMVLAAVGSRCQSGESPIRRCGSSVTPDKKVLCGLMRLSPARQAGILAMQSMLAESSPSFFQLLVAASRPDEVLAKIKVPGGITAKEFASVEKRFRPVEEELGSIAPAYPSRAYALALTQVYVRTILKNQKVAAYIFAKHPKIHRRLAPVLLNSS